MPVVVDNSTKKQVEGVWAKFDDSQFKIASTHATKFQRSLNRLQAPYRKKIEKGTMDPKISKEILCQAMAESLIVDWKGVTDSSGADVPFSAEMCQKMLMNNDDVREYLLDFAQDLQNFKAEELAEAGNS